MGQLSLRDITLTPLAQIATPGGDVWHGMRQHDPGYGGFGEAYFSWIEAGAVKAWKRHTRMTMNVIVPVGSARFVFTTDDNDDLRIEKIGADRYARISVPPGIWFGFQGLGDVPSLVLNIASIPHDPAEVERRMRDQINFDWTAR